MPPISGQPPDQSSDTRFKQVLADVRRAAAHRREGASEEVAAASSPARPLAGAIFPVDDGAGRPTGGASHWQAALAFLEEQDEPAALVELKQGVEEGADAILQELGLTESLTGEELARLRRLYMWRHHPDRHAESHRASATRRVAIANMLVDRARSRLAGRS